MNSVQEKSNTAEGESWFTLGPHPELLTLANAQLSAAFLALLDSPPDGLTLDDDLYTDYDDEGMDCD